MGFVKGNLGNLMQHWTWAETLTAIQREVTFRGATLHLVDAHAMAPGSDRLTVKSTFGADGRFARIWDGLPGAGSSYERAWSACLVHAPDRYPSTAALTLHLWAGGASLDLCELDSEAAAEIQRWSRALSARRHDAQVMVHCGDWRRRFERGIAPAGDLLALAFDPVYFAGQGKPVFGDDRMFPSDLGLLLQATSRVTTPVLVMLTQYAIARGASTHQAVLSCWDTMLTASGFQRVGLVVPDCTKMAAVYGRGLPVEASGQVRQAVRQAAFMAWLLAADSTFRRRPTGCPELMQSLGVG